MRELFLGGILAIIEGRHGREALFSGCMFASDFAGGMAASNLKHPHRDADKEWE